MEWRARRETREGQRLTKMTAALIVQEAEKFRALIRDAGTS
jgi:hypothetical protein